ncbi:DMT family transporter [Neptunomonas sp.]|uniref:DMT family transporter n=1 Tax=Neptunomonas sp. TaxID=1971898 RepID=UPI0025EDC1D9|nr:DMT family transporter [Neptunomonas sp.]
MLGRWVPVVSLFLAMLLWASSFIALKIAFEFYDPMVVIFGRMFIAAICFIFFLKYLMRFQYQKGDWRLLLLMVISEPCLYFLFEAHALQNTSAAQAGMITSMAPLLVGLGALYFLKEKLQKEVWVGFLVAVVGAIWLSLSGDETEHAPNPLLGNFLELCAMVCATGYTLCLKHLSQRYSTWFLTALQAFCGTFFFLPFLPFSGEGAVWHIGWELDGVLAILYLGTLINIGAYGLYNLGVSKIKAAEASAYINLIPVFTLLMAYLILHETFNIQQMCASVLVLGGVFLSQRKASVKVEAVNATVV